MTFAKRRKRHLAIAGVIPFQGAVPGGRFNRVNAEMNGVTEHRNLLCVGFNADPHASAAFQKPSYPNLWFLPVSSFLATAPTIFNAEEIGHSAATDSPLAL